MFGLVWTGLVDSTSIHPIRHINRLHLSLVKNTVEYDKNELLEPICLVWSGLAPLTRPLAILSHINILHLSLVKNIVEYDENDLLEPISLVWSGLAPMTRPLSIFTSN